MTRSDDIARSCLRGLAAAVLSLAATGFAQAAETLVFSTDFDGAALPAQIEPGVAALTGVQGFAGLGPSGNQFGGSFLRSPTGNTVSLTLTGLATHDRLNIAFLFAAIDSLDGTGNFPSGDFLNVSVDGVSIFRESFANALAGQVQSYVAPTGVELARRVDLGFGGPGGFYTDSAYNLGADPRFQQIAHSGSTAVITFLIEGEGIQPLSDESWAIDNLQVSIISSAVPEPASLALWVLGLAGLAAYCRRRGA
ncbi:PEP-CTERM sorting domain-containing protein [Paucibacter sp. XJ19-41]|uniref:PEP-CTERM sorting domain-containing protein n=1 Tax=Paucibacter sp. XJ19-41 TaxID=2927824 RepID=UPI00234B236E|nr:PEP-CTERM sorting domain-containing protein [Paucibacter sp. XJ19-41]MDC6167371.1 PEP-CTERM sorting domain-containing protein [Paucibacter sp. XJ19-41]